MHGERVLVVAPHPDDEVLGAAGTIGKFALAGARVWVVIVSHAQPPRFPITVGLTGLAEARSAHALLGVERTLTLDFPTAELDHIPHADVNAGLLAVFHEFEPTLAFVPFGGDLFIDHQAVAMSSIVCARPLSGSAPRGLYCYETLPQTNWNAPYAPRFAPTAFVDITDQLAIKLDAMSCFASQLRAFPHERSLEAVTALATLRGAQFGCKAAEAFVTIRERLG